MPVIRIETFIRAPAEACFDRARDVEAHVASASRTKERAIAGVTTGLLGLGDEVTWEAVHFGVRQRLTSRITRFDRPRMFVDEMVRGAFASFEHVHEFVPSEGGTTMIDTFTYRAPLGPLGRVADVLFLERHMRRFLVERANALREALEA
ncbi:MAG TPA: SRPBCC family protein [Labilithrix sp.]|jgi:ligand-binding SRPBCC domain-containing protein